MMQLLRHLFVVCVCVCICACACVCVCVCVFTFICVEFLILQYFIEKCQEKISEFIAAIR